tara:strand:- start:548 stop:1087 length:540 start_codon:yes stop_codon:yes gene_type:complete
MSALKGDKKSTPKKELAGASKDEVARGTAAAQLRSEFAKQLAGVPAAVARGEAQTGALGLRGRGRNMFSAGQTRGLGAQIGAATAQAGLEVTEKKAEIQKQAASKKKAVMQEIENLRTAKRHDKAEVAKLKAIYGDDQEMLDFIEEQVQAAPSKSQSTVDSEKTLGDDVKDFVKYINPF